MKTRAGATTIGAGRSTVLAEFVRFGAAAIVTIGRGVGGGTAMLGENVAELGCCGLGIDTACDSHLVVGLFRTPRSRSSGPGSD